jgi:Uma2 family endonuclease
VTGSRDGSVFDSNGSALQLALMSTVPQSLLLTVANYRDLGEGPPHYQLIEGEILLSPAPNRYHQVISRNLEFILMRYLADHPIGEIYHAPFDVYLDDLNAYQPDIVFVGTERKRMLEDDGAHGAPDLVVEILSPSTTRLDKRKRAHFAKHGTREFWQIDPNLQQIQRFDFARDPAKPVQIIDEAEVFESPLFPGLKISAAEVFKP